MRCVQNSCARRFFEALGRWNGIVDDMLANATLPDENKLSRWAPVAKAGGACLNFNCSLILLPVLYHVLHYGHRKMKFCPMKCCRCRLAKKVPLGENVRFHKHIAYVIAGFAGLHTFAHYVNYQSKPTAVETAFESARWYGIPGLGWKWFTGSVTTMCILVMYSAAQDATRRHSHKAFWLSHQLFGLFWLCLLLHGPIFYAWISAPLLLYATHRMRIGRREVVLRECTLEEPNVLRLAFDNTDHKIFGGSNYREGTYVRIMAPDLSVTECKPRTAWLHHTLPSVFDPLPKQGARCHGWPCVHRASVHNLVRAWRGDSDGAYQDLVSARRDHELDGGAEPLPHEATE